ncbi:MFS transporter [Burkholderia cenocepacia]|uniref:MFS transporter n=1 Tax=Burkholderia cenocepacia TaxID=95486 RepID=UPI0028566AA1|nr:MFS transporter [Burkholderia cenocepacia]MDR8071874.1 MFS transporter [Burkholderia cenocepacia]
MELQSTSEANRAPIAADAVDISSRTAEAYRIITRKIVPFLLLAYLVCNIDRMNAGFAALDFQKDLGFGAAVYGLGASLFFIGYSLFELPSNLVLERIGARKTFVRIMILWGLASAAQAFVKTPMQFYIVRIFLGAAEAGFLPGAIFYLTHWFPSSRRARIQSLFYIGMPIAGLIGSPVSGFIMHALSASSGLKGWQWMFIIEAAPTIALGIYAWFFLTESPAKADWLTKSQRRLVLEDLQADEKTRLPARHRSSLTAAVREPRVWIAAFTYICLVCTSSALSFWMPSVIKSFGFADPLLIGMLSACPALAMLAWMIFLSRRSDRKQERRWHLGASLLCGSLCLVGLALSTSNTLLSLTLLTMASGLIAGTYPVFWAIPSAILPPTARAAGIGLIGGIGSLGGLLGASVFGWTRAHFGSFTMGLYFIAAIIAAGAFAVIAGIPRNPTGK